MFMTCRCCNHCFESHKSSIRTCFTQFWSMTSISHKSNSAEAEHTKTDTPKEDIVSYTNTFALNKDDCETAMNKIQENDTRIINLKKWLQNLLEDKVDTDEVIITEKDADAFLNHYTEHCLENSSE